MKRILIMLLCAVGMSACLGTHYFEPEVVETSDEEEMISYLGDTCWFQVEFRQVMTKFEPGEDFKPFKYVVEIEGMESSDPVTVEHDRDFAELIEELEQKYPEFYENWRKGNGSVPKFWSGVIAFEVPSNLSEAQRKVEVKVSIANKYDDIDNWGEWETVFSAVQEGFAIETSKGGRILIDYEFFAAGKDAAYVSSLLGSDPLSLGSDPLFMDNGICRFIEYYSASSTGKIGIDVCDAGGNLKDTGSILNFSNQCKVFPEAFSEVLPDRQIISRLLWEVNFEKNGRRTFYVLIVKGEGPYGIFGPAHEVYLFEDLTEDYKAKYDIDYVVKRHRLVYVADDEILVDHMVLDGYKVMFGEYEVSSVICFDEMTPEHLIEPATAKLQEGRSLQDGSRVCLNHDMTYSIKKDGNEISSGTYETGIYENDTCEEMCYYYPGPRSSKGYLELTDANGNRLLFGMFIAANENSEPDYGTLWPYQAFEITEGDRHIDYGIRYGLTYCG